MRSAKLKVVTKAGKPTALRRPVQRLFPLEVRAKNTPEQDDSTEQLEEPIAPSRPPRRRAAINADVVRRLIHQA